MNHRFECLLALALSSSSMSFGAVTKSCDPKRSSCATADSSRSFEAREEKWERDPVVFSQQDRETIRAYYRAASANPTVRQQTKGNGYNPPNHLQRRSLLPLGLRDQLQSLSNDLETRLRPLYSGYARGMIGHDIMIIESRSRRIMDIIRDVTGQR